LDELPQLWNVVAGHMALVGPRPCLPSQKELIQARRQADVFSVRPGITGQAQVAGVDMSALDRIVQEDTDYVRGRNLSSDIRLLRLTFDGLTRQAPVKT
jgi:O-antigen biosynthesis protein WbqP